MLAGASAQRQTVAALTADRSSTMIAIETRYIPVTNTKPSRIKAYTCNPGQSVMMSKQRAEELSPDKGNHEEDTHRVVAQALADKMGWGPLGPCGATKRGYAFVFVERK